MALTRKMLKGMGLTEEQIDTIIEGHDETVAALKDQITDLKEKDYKRLLQPVIDGNEIMEIFHLQPSPAVGTLKQYLKDAVLDNQVPNEREPLMELLMAKAKELGLVP